MNESLISEFLSLGCESRKDAVITLQIYLELSEIKKFWDIEYKYNNKLKKLYLTGKKTKSAITSTFIPMSYSDGLNFNQMQTLFNINGNENNKNVYLAMVTPDSTCVYYEISNGLIEPSDTTAKHRREDKRDKLDNELEKNRHTLEQAALYGIPVTIPIGLKTDSEIKQNILR